MLRKIILIFSLLAAVPANAVSIEDDRFSKTIVFKGESKRHLQGSGPSDSNVLFIRSWLEKETGRVTHQLYVNHTYHSDGWKFWSRASDENANDLRFVSIDRDVKVFIGCCLYSEDFGISIAESILDKSKSTGLLIKIYAKSGDQKILNISAEQIASQLFAIEQKKISLSTQAPSVPKQSPQRPATDSLGLTNGPQDLLNCKIGTSALVRTTSEKCELAGGVKVQ